jgi:lysophospholipase L1-like esterase
MKRLIATFLSFFAFNLAYCADEEITTIHMAGDSTMAIKEVKDYPETGWGVPFSVFFDESVEVINYAQNGRSTRTFIEDGLWQSVIGNLEPGDYVIIQFGHNDESESKTDRYTTPEQYKTNLTRFIEETRQRGATPILLSPVTRRHFNGQGQIGQTHAYAPLSVEVAIETEVDFIDMDMITREYFQAMGEKDSAIRFMHIPPDTHPNYPHGVRDDTHFNHLGAREVAQLFLAELKARNHPLASRLRRPDPKHLKLEY